MELNKENMKKIMLLIVFTVLVLACAINYKTVFQYIAVFFGIIFPFVLGGIIAFSIVTETVFQWPGMGLLFLQAVQFADIPVLSAYLCLIALVFVVINFCVDLLYMLIDPRLRVRRS